jgi:NADH dehydrogenase
MRVKAAVTGANGFVGTHTIQRLSAANYEPVGIVRSKEKAVVVKDAGGTPVVVEDLLDEDALAHAFKGCETVFHFVGESFQTPENTFEKFVHQVTRSVARASAAAGVERLVNNSGLGVREENTNSFFLKQYMGEAEAKKLLRELGFGDKQEYFESKAAAEREIKKSGVDHTIFRPSFMIGPGDVMNPPIKKKLLERRPVVIQGNEKTKFQPIHIDDATGIYLECAQGKGRNKTFDLVGQREITVADYVRLAGKILGKKPLIEFEDVKTALRNAARPGAQRTLDEVIVFICNEVADPRPIEKEFNVKLTSVEDALRKTLGAT